MPKYFLDTNILIDYGRNPAVRQRLECARVNGVTVLIAPPALVELTRGMVKAGPNHFHNDQQVFMWFRRHDLEVLPLPNPFLADLLRSVARRRSGVEPTHYRKLIEMVSTASDFEAFIKATAGTVWRDVNRADEIHNAELDRELAALGTLAKKNLGSDVARRLSRQFGVPGCHPNPVIVAQKLSAALEFLQSCMKKVKDGANPRKNNAGLYTDFQLLLYLGSPDFVFLTREDFRSDIKISPQRNRIVDLDSLRP